VKVVLNLIENRGHCWLDLEPLDIVEPPFGALTVPSDCQFIGSSSKSTYSAELLLFLVKSRTEAESTVCVTIHHKVIVCCTATSVSFVVFVDLASLHSQIIGILLFNIMPRKYLVEPEVKVDKLFKSITIAVYRCVSINGARFMNILVA